MITRIEAYRYRCFRSLNAKMQPFQVLVGANGSGKTTMLDIPIVLGEILSTRSIETAFQEKTKTHPRPRTDYAGDLIYNQQGESFKLAVEAEIPEGLVSELVKKAMTGKGPKTVSQYQAKPERWPSSVRYEISFELFNGALQIAEENVVLIQKDDTNIPRDGATSVAEWARKRTFSRFPEVVPVLERSRGGSALFTPEMETRRQTLPFFDQRAHIIGFYPLTQTHIDKFGHLAGGWRLGQGLTDAFSLDAK